MPEELWTFKNNVHDIVQEAVIKTIPKKKKCKKAKWLFEEDLQIAEERREAKSKGKKGNTAKPSHFSFNIAFRFLGKLQNVICTFWKI